MADLEQIILSHLVRDEPYTRKVIPHLTEEYFTSPETQIVFNTIKTYLNEYNALPTVEALTITVGNSPIDEGTFDKVTQCLDSLSNVKSQKTEWLIDESEKWAKERALHNALMEAVDITMGKGKKTKENIPDILSQALRVAFDSDTGYDWADKAEERFNGYHLKENKIAFPFKWLNDTTNNGVTKKTLSIFMAGVNVGKSIWLCQLAGHYMMQGLNVLYVSMEMAEEVVAERVDVNMLDVTFEQLKTLQRNQYMTRVGKIASKTKGKLKVKQFPTGGAHVGHLRHLFDELKMKEDFVPDILIVDYLTIMASSKLPGSMKSNTNTYFTAVTEELRGFAIEKDLPIFTAAQFGRSQQNGKATDADMSDIAAAIGIANTADLMIAGIAPDELMQRDEIIWKILKNRFGSRMKNRTTIMGIDTDKQRFYDLDGGSDAESYANADKELSAMDEAINKDKTSQINFD